MSIKLNLEKLNEISDELDWYYLIEKYTNLELKKHWQNYVTICPFHNENTPSFVISTSKKIMKCFWCWKSFKNIFFFFKEYFWDNNLIETIKKLEEDINDEELLSKINFFNLFNEKFSISEKELSEINRIIFYYWNIYKIKKSNKNDFKWIDNEIKSILEKNLWNFILKYFDWYFIYNLNNKKSEKKYINYWINDFKSIFWIQKEYNFQKQKNFNLPKLIFKNKKINIEETYLKLFKNNIKNFEEINENYYLKEYWIEFNDFLKYYLYFLIDFKENFKLNIFFTEWFFDAYELTNKWIVLFSNASLEKNKFIKLISEQLNKFWTEKKDIILFFDADSAWKKISYVLKEVLNNFTDEFNINNIFYFNIKLFESLVKKFKLILKKAKALNDEQKYKLLDYISQKNINLFNTNSIDSFIDIYSILKINQKDLEESLNEKITLKDANDVFKIIKELIIEVLKINFKNTTKIEEEKIKKFLIFILKKLFSHSILLAEQIKITNSELKKQLEDFIKDILSNFKEKKKKKIKKINKYIFNEIIWIEWYLKSFFVSILYLIVNDIEFKQKISDILSLIYKKQKQKIINSIDKIYKLNNDEILFLLIKIFAELWLNKIIENNDKINKEKINELLDLWIKNEEIFKMFWISQQLNKWDLSEEFVNMFLK